MAYRPLKKSEILRLEKQGCRAESWERIRVHGQFQADFVRDSEFGGDVELGKFENAGEGPGGVRRSPGVYRSRVHDCRIMDNATVSDVGLIARYVVGKDAVVERVSSIRVDGENTFGNGTEVEVFNEAGGRTLRIHDRLSAQLAYLTIFYRYRPALIRKLAEWTEAYVASRKSGTGVIGEGSRIQDAGTLLNVHIGPHARITGALRLEAGTIASSEAAPAVIGAGVIARRFIVLSGSVLDDGAVLTSSFVGQGVRMGKQYSADNSAFFANSELFHGEGCSVLAGPYTVTHHKSTLLIAGFFSFYNAGSGSNQSNHMYKLGPVHQGILERGSKTGSFSYMLWPTHVGPFSNVIGKHHNSFDASDFPFSLIQEENGKTVITPGMNLCTVGVRRDGMKWPTRDNRKDERLDLIHFDVFSPYTGGRMKKAVEKLKDLQVKAAGNEFVMVKGAFVNRLMMRTGIKYYEMGIRIFIGEKLVKYLEGLPPGASMEQLRRGLENRFGSSLPEWADVGGMFVPMDRLESLISDAEAGRISGLEDMHQRLRGLHGSYDQETLAWCAAFLADHLKVELSQIHAGHLKGIIEEWKAAALKQNNLILQDAAKEYGAVSMIGYGRDGSEEQQKADFEAVRGNPESNGFIRSVQEDSRRIEETSDRIQKFLDRLA
jgi:NDP-sugar pyrophosphorylase family protein